MILQDELLEKHGLNVKHLDEGNHKIKCPQCQPPHDSHDRPMSVEISYDKIVFFCHHCEFKGGVMAQSALVGAPQKSAPQKKTFTQNTSTFLDEYFEREAFQNLLMRRLRFFQRMMNG